MTRPQTESQAALDSLVRGTISGLTESQIEDLRRYLECRLSDMGEEGDCAYERAMGKVYLQLITALQPAPAASATVDRPTLPSPCRDRQLSDEPCPPAGVHPLPKAHHDFPRPRALRT